MPDNSPQQTDIGARTIDKAKLLLALRAKGQDGRAEFVDRQLPEIIDIEANAGLLRTLGIDVAELAR